MWSAARAVELEPEATELIRFPKSLQYSAIPYLPQAAGITLRRWSGGSPLTLLFCARIANLVVAAGLIFLCVAQLPAYRWFAVLVALTPMAMSLRSSVSADAPTMAIAFLFTAVVTRIAFVKTSNHGSRDLGLVAVLACALCLTKPVYFPLVLRCLAIPPRRLGTLGRGLLVPMILAASIIAVVIGIAIVLPSAGSVTYRIGPRLAELAARPLHFPASAVADYVVHAPRYGAHFIGRLGWLDTPLPPALIIAYALFLMAYAVIDSDASTTIEWWQRLVLAAAVVASLFAISAAFYVIVGRIEGIQGRYFHPLALAAVWPLHNRMTAGLTERAWLRPMGAILLTLSSLLVSWWTVLQQYYGA